jgi:Holliday junction DNA helicase RuvA
MIYRLTGRLEPIAPRRALIEVRGVAYELQITQRDVEALQLQHGRDAEVSVVTELIHRPTDETPLLFAFAEARARQAFRTLRNLPGLGPAKALDVLDALGVDGLHHAIATQDRRALTRAPGIGARVAGRILSEWPERVAAPTPDSASAAAPAQPSARDAAIEGLRGLGYKPHDAEAAIAAVAPEHPDADASVLLRAALRHVANQHTGRASA